MKKIEKYMRKTGNFLKAILFETNEFNLAYFFRSISTSDSSQINIMPHAKAN